MFYKDDSLANENHGTHEQWKWNFLSTCTWIWICCTFMWTRYIPVCVALVSKIENNNSNPKQNLISQKSHYEF